MTVHARGDDAEPDFEWVNTWAATARSAPVVAPIGGSAELTAAMHLGSADAGVASTPAAPSPQASARADFDAEQAQSAAVPLFETTRRRKRWTHLFRIIARAREAGSPSHPGLSMLDPPEMSSQAAGRPQDAGEANDAAAMLDVGQVERDIAEIQLVRDRLLSEFAPARRKAADRLASARTSDYVPILVGGVFAFTSLVVFGAAASFVSLR
jgi:hypothetical protein